MTSEEIKSSIPVKEDNNRTGLGWAFVVERSDVQLSGIKNDIINKSPFSPEVTKYVQDIMRDATNMLIDTHEVRSLSKLGKILTLIKTHYHKNNRIPAISDITVLGHPEGLQVYIYLGDGYMVPFDWTMYNDSWLPKVERYKREGVTELKEIINQMKIGKLI